MTWLITGVDKNTGKELVITVDGRDRPSALRAAERTSILVERVEVFAENPPSHLPVVLAVIAFAFFGWWGYQQNQRLQAMERNEAQMQVEIQSLRDDVNDARWRLQSLVDALRR